MTEQAKARALQDVFWLRAEELLMLHTNPWELDEALTNWGYDMGPCEAMDLLGLDRVLTRAPDRRTPVLQRMLAEGRLGKQGGVGFYRYPGGGGAVIDPLIEDLIREEAWFAKVTRAEVPPETLVAEMNATFAGLGDFGLGRGDLGKMLARAVGFPAERLNTLRF